MQTSMGLAQSSTSAEPHRIIGDGAGIPDGTVEGLDPDRLLELYRWMVLLRTYDERSLVYHRQGRIGTYAIYWGHEAIQAGGAFALERDDWIFPSYRESAIGLVRGMRVSTVLAWWRGHPEGWWDPREQRVASICVPIATHVPHAAGLAWGIRLRGLPRLRHGVLGDGAHLGGRVPRGRSTSPGSPAPPLVLMCNNNPGRSRPRSREQTRGGASCRQGGGVRHPGVRVDGSDVLAVYAALPRRGSPRPRG